MSKRKSGSDDDSPRRKRQKITKVSVHPQEFVKIQNSKDLQLLLAFEQNTGPEVRQRIQSFKLFLDSITYGKESDERSARRVILLEYLQSQQSNQKENPSPHLADLVRTWQFATQVNVESLYSSVVGVLALLLKAISTLVEFRDCGNHLCRSLLQDDQVKLFDRGLSANKAKEHLISPCLRLLAEIVSFDGGNSARIVFRQRKVLFKRLEVFLGMRNGSSGEEVESRKRPPVRNLALRYLYANLKLQGPAAKTYILAQGKIVRAVFEDIFDDPPTQILELLEILKRDVACDSALPHAAKSRMFNEWALSRLATLYNYPEIENAHEGRLIVQEAAHKFLLFVCTSSDHGVLENQVQRDVGIENDKLGDLSGSENYVDTTSYKDNKPTGRSIRLALFLQSLRPYASVLQSELILAVFRTVPEMVPDYFARKKSFSFDPKATATWIGYSTFLIATVRLPLPRSLQILKVKDMTPSPAITIIDSIMPQPMTQKVMTRCLNQSITLIKFMTTRLLTAAFEKLAEVLQIYRGRHDHLEPKRSYSKSSQAASELTAEFCSRLPEIDHVIAQLQGCSVENAILRESLTRLLALYYVVIPQEALEAKFDISIALSPVLQDGILGNESQWEHGVRILELDNLLDIAKRSPTMQWWHKSDKMWLSPFTALLKLLVDRRQARTESRKSRSLLLSVVQENQILDPDNSMLSLNALVIALQNSDNWKASNKVFEFLDNCVLRLVRSPIHYYDMLTELVATTDDVIETGGAHVDLLLIAVFEQWPHMVKAADDATVTNVAIWLGRYIEFSWLRIRNNSDVRAHRSSANVLTQIRDQITVLVKDSTCRSVLQRTLSDPPKLDFSIDLPTVSDVDEHGCEEEHRSQPEKQRPEPYETAIPPGPQQEHEDHPGLTQWTRQDIVDGISDGAIERLLLCLCSKYAEIRQQAMRSVGSFMAKLEESGYSEWQQTFVVTGELIETAKDFPSGDPLPYFAGVLAARLLLVVADPLHIMYEKVNGFLHKGPRWNVAKLPSYWVDKIMLNPPTGDDAHNQEVEWLLDALVDGLRTSTDFEIYHRCRIFQRLLSFAASPSLPQLCLEKIIAFLFRCTYVGGSSTLVTRYGLISWIAARLALCGSRNTATTNTLRTLASTIYGTSDQDHLNDWSNGNLAATLDKLQASKI